MSKKRRMFDIDMPQDEAAPLETKSASRSPMAAAISENAEALKARRTAEDAIRAENDALAHEHVRLKKLGLIVDLIPLDDVVAEKLARDRRAGDDMELAELKASIQAIGLSNPIRVEAREDGKFELVQGMRRLTAYRELLAETGEDVFKTIPAGIVAQGEALQAMYRRMVDENLVRKDISFAEMADLARRYAADPATQCVDVDKAVAELFQSAGYQKRSYIRAFVGLMERLDKVLAYPQAIPRNLGLNLRKRIQADPAIIVALSRELAGWDNRSIEDELGILRKYASGEGGSQSAAPASEAPRKAKTTFQVKSDAGVAKCTASQGRLEVKLNRDFSAIERARLELAVAALLERL